MLSGAEGGERSTAEPLTPSAAEPAGVIVSIRAGCAIARAWLAYLRGEPATMASFAAQARAELGEGQLMLESLYQLNLALADWLGGKLADAEREFTDLVARWRSFGETSLAARGCRFVGQVQCDQGRLDAALRTYTPLVATAADPDQPPPPAAPYGD